MDYDALAQRRRVLVRGAAGTGKTYLARQVCRRWSEDQGRRVLVLTATDPLYRWWERKAPRGVRVASVPRLCRELLQIDEPKRTRKRGDWTRDEEWDEEFWDELPRRAAEELALSGEGWEAVIVDGATDMSDAAWKLIDACAPNVLWACEDPLRQFWSDRRVPRALFDEVHELSEQRRPQSIHGVALRYLADNPGEDPLPPEVTVDERSVDEVVAEVLASTKPWHVAVLSVRGRGERRGAIRERPVRGAVGGSSRRFDQAMVLETFLRFSGLERRTVVLMDLDLVDDRYEHRMYLALTRATERVIVCAPRAVIEHDEILYAALGD